MECSKDFIVDDYIAKSIGFTNGFNSTMFSADDYVKFRNLRNSLIMTCAFGSAELVDLTEKMTTGNTEPFPECKSFDPMLTNRGVCQTFKNLMTLCLNFMVLFCSTGTQGLRKGSFSLLLRNPPKISLRLVINVYFLGISCPFFGHRSICSKFAPSPNSSIEGSN